MGSVNIGNKDDGVKVVAIYKTNTIHKTCHCPCLAARFRGFAALCARLNCLSRQTISYAGQDFLDRRFFKSSFLVLHIYNIVLRVEFQIAG